MTPEQTQNSSSLEYFTQAVKYFKWFEYFILIFRANKGHGGLYKQHPPFTET